MDSVALDPRDLQAQREEIDDLSILHLIYRFRFALRFWSLQMPGQ